jgi:hypothetical protein
MQTQQSRAEYEISTDTHRLNVDVIHKFLAEDSYWSPESHDPSWSERSRILSALACTIAPRKSGLLA